MTSEYKLIKSSNSRLLYKETWGRALNWQGLSGELDYFIDLNRAINKVDDFLYLYFFEFPFAENFLEYDVWVGKEITGFIELDEDDEFHSYDLDAGFLYEAELPFDPEGYLTFSEVFSWVEKNIQKSEILDKVASTWRLKLTISGKYPKITPQFFASEDE